MMAEDEWENRLEGFKIANNCACNFQLRVKIFYNSVFVVEKQK